ncbi:UvrB/UvrC motif-containing protein [Candidatus Poribacteria bacterium]|nr:UvrB/UvrC motif-containing protein [Candidatus Poribacteria bacterium]
MKCERCGKDEAVIKLTRIERGGEVLQVVLCQSCAAEASPYQKKILQKSAGASLDMLLKELLKQQKGQAGAPVDDSDARGVPPCSSCGLEYAAYRKTYMLGCPGCYEHFAEQLESDLHRVHRATRHIGDGPRQSEELVELQERLEEMRAELKEAIEDEDFERAAFLRDEIGRIEKSVLVRSAAPAEARPQGA